MSCHGWQIHSVEGIGGPTTGYHEIQKLLAENNGTQCGFCSPGMVMNMYALQQSGPKTKEEIENSFGGNICRCTGYRPIMTAFFNLASNKITDIEDVNLCLQKCTKRNNEKDAYVFSTPHSNWVKVYYIKDLIDILRTSGDVHYMLVGGNTAQGVVWPTSYPALYIDVVSVEELTSYTVSELSLILGANLSLTKTLEIFRSVAKKYPNFNYLSSLVAHIDLVANVPVRNIGTLAGNLMLKHATPRFQSDIFLILETIKATLIIVDLDENELRKSPQEFLTIDMKKKFIKEIELRPFDPKEYHYRSYKIMNRAQNTHAIVNAGFLFKLSSEGVVQSASIVYGAISSNFVHASLTEALLKDQNLFSNVTIQKALASLNQELDPDVNPPDPSPECRKQLALNLFYKCILSIAPINKVSPRNESGASLITRPLSSGVQEFSTNQSMYPVSKPVTKAEALAQTSGQAQYIVDKPDLPNQLHACLVTAEAVPGSVIQAIDASKALAVEDVVAFYSASDIPGTNSITVISMGLKPEELFCSNQVEHFSQPVGVVVAEKHESAVKAAALVKVICENHTTKPLLSVKDILEAKRTDRIIHQTSVVPKATGKEIKKIQGEFYIGSQYHFHMETQCCYVVPQEEGLEVWPGTQWISFTQFMISQLLNIDCQKIDVHVKRLGGSYGGKIIKSGYTAGATALAAYKLQRPVKMWTPFHINMKAVGKRMPLYANYKVGVDSRGIIQNMETNLYTDSGMGLGNELVDPFLRDCFENCYKIDTWGFDTYLARTDTHPNTWTRSPGTLEGLACIESIMEHIALSLNLNPVEVKLANLDAAKYPKIQKFYSDMRNADKLDQRMDDIKAYNEANRWKKKGLSVVPMKFTLDVLGSYTTLVSVYFQNGGVAISHGGVEMGQGINTKVIQVCSHKLGIPMELISVKPSSSLTSPNSFASGGSWTSEAVCQSVIVSCDKILDRMKPVREKNPEASWLQLVQLSFAENINLSANGFVYNDQKTIQSYPIYGLCAAEVEVDILTGQNVIRRVDIIEDVGDSMNPLIDIGQVEGAFIMGVGYHLMENLVWSSDGELLTNRTWNYTPPGVKDIPVDFRIKFPANNPNPVGILNSKATAEPPICLSVAVPLAIRNAITSARNEADSTKSTWFPFEGPTSTECILLNSLNDYKKYTL